MSKPPPRIDFHSHFLSPAYRQACLDNGFGKPDGMPALPEWTPEMHLELMARNGISKSILSVSSPGTHLVAGDRELAARVSRESNAYAAKLKRQHPDKFGFFAILPLPEVDLCLEEIAQSAEEGCDGYALLTNGHGHYLGAALLDPIFNELNRRRAKIFVHPTTAMCACTIEGQLASSTPIKAVPLEAQYPDPMMEFFFDTARAVVNLFLTGTIARCPNVQIILPHLGGAIPPLISRFTGFSSLIDGSWEQVSEKDVQTAFARQIWFDLAGFPFPSQFAGIMKSCQVPHSRILYGSDYPFTNVAVVEDLAAKMDIEVRRMFSEAEIEDIYYKNGEKLLSM